MKNSAKKFLCLMVIVASLLTGCSGKDGIDGVDGKDGKTPTISINENGYWVINGVTTSILAKAENGTDGKDGQSTTISINENGYWVVNGVVTNIKAQGEDGADGKDGLAGQNGIDGKDGIDGQNGTDGKDGKDGIDGQTPTVTINEEGYWVINGVVTNVKAQGEAGKDGADLSGTELADFYLQKVNLVVLSSNLGVANSTYPILDNGNVCLGTINDNICDNELFVDSGFQKPTSGKITVANNSVVDYQMEYSDKFIMRINNEMKNVYKESNIEVPDLYNGTLTPVIYDGNNWVVADASSKWYSYVEQEWANAVILKKGIEKNVGDTVSVTGSKADALAMLVWIPRYEYKIEGTYGKGGTSTSSPGEIEINFISVNDTVASEGYKVHPAFNFGGKEISGIWMSKFELSHETLASSTPTDNLECSNEECEISSGLRSKPNVQALRKNKISGFFYAIKSMNKENNVFGINKQITDTHMIKNSEWGAVAYLTQSRYGKYGNINYEGAEREVYINNSASYYTGRSGGSYSGNTAVNTVYTDKPDVETQYSESGFYTYDGYLLKYNTNTKTDIRDMKKIASTTGNIYGVYDMSGGAWDSTMAVLSNSDGYKIPMNSGFKGVDIEGIEWPEEKYYNVYKAGSGTTINIQRACNGGVCYGHAISETQSWYLDFPNFVSAAGSWLIRGGAFNSKMYSGIFSFYSSVGNSSPDKSTRFVLTSNT